MTTRLFAKKRNIITYAVTRIEINVRVNESLIIKKGKSKQNKNMKCLNESSKRRIFSI